MRVSVVASDVTGRQFAGVLVDALRLLVPAHDYDVAALDADDRPIVTRGQGALLCVTPASLEDERLFVDLGRLQGAVGLEGFVAPVLLDLSPDDVAQTPLAIFQCTRAQRDDLQALTLDLLRRCGDGPSTSPQVPDFDRVWDDLRMRLGDVPGAAVRPFLVTLLLPERPVSFGFDPGADDCGWDESVGAALRSLPGSPIKPPPFNADSLVALDVETSRWIERPRRVSRVTTKHIALAAPVVIEEAHGDARPLARMAREEAARFGMYGGAKVMPWKFLLGSNDKLLLLSNVR